MSTPLPPVDTLLPVLTIDRLPTSPNLPVVADDRLAQHGAPGAPSAVGATTSAVTPRYPLSSSAAPLRPWDDWLAGQISSETARAYRNDLAQFLAWCQAHYLVSGPQEVTRQMVIHYREWLKQQGRAPATMARKLSSVRTALGFALEEGLIARNPAAGVKPYKVPRVSPRHAVDDAQVRVLLSQPDQTTLKGKRDYAILMLLCYLGLRRGEVAAMRTSWWYHERGHLALSVVGKGDKARQLAVKPETARAVRAYLEADGRGLMTDGYRHDEPLFRAVAGRGTGAQRSGYAGPRTVRHADGRVTQRQCGVLTGPAIWQVVHGYAVAASAAGAQKAHDVHTLRHTAISNALDHGAPIHRVAAMAGHASIETTNRYKTRNDALDESAAYLVDYNG
jgi:site-specific recombinase XerD